MDTLLHGVSTGIVANTLGCSLEQSIVVGAVSTSPDVIGFTEKVVTYRWDSWKWYQFSHSLFFSIACFLLVMVGSGFMYHLKYITTQPRSSPEYWFVMLMAFSIPVHNLIDFLWHKKEGGWKDWGWWADGLLWLPCIGIIVGEYLRWII